MSTIRVLAVPGSLRRGSHNTALARAAAEVAPEGVEVTVWEGLRELPHYDADLDGDDPPAAVAALRETFAAADALLFVTPEYNASIPGVLKNAVDWLSRPFPGNAVFGRPTAVVGASTGRFGGVWAQDELRKSLRTAGARVVPGGVAVPKAPERFDADGRLADDELRGQLHDLLGELVAEVSPVGS
jgi:chromate reductase